MRITGRSIPLVQVTLEFIQPGKPTQNSYIERFNRTYREEVLDFYIFKNLNEVREITEKWMSQYNTERPHQSLKNMTPNEYSLCIKKHGKLHDTLVLNSGALQSNPQKIVFLIIVLSSVIKKEFIQLWDKCLKRSLKQGHLRWKNLSTKSGEIHTNLVNSLLSRRLLI